MRKDAIQTCLTLKVLFGLPLHRTVGLARSPIRMTGPDWPVPDHSTLCRRQARIAVQIPYRPSGQPSSLLIDNEASTAIGPRTIPDGIEFRDAGEWLARKHVSSRQKRWRKVHIAVNAGRGGVRAVGFT